MKNVSLFLVFFLSSVILAADIKSINLTVINVYKPDVSELEIRISENKIEIDKLKNDLRLNKDEFWNVAKCEYGYENRLFGTSYNFSFRENFRHYGNYRRTLINTIHSQKMSIEDDYNSLINLNNRLINKLNQLKMKVIILCIDENKNIYLVNTDQIHLQIYPIKSKQNWTIDGIPRVTASGDIIIFDLIKAKSLDTISVNIEEYNKDIVLDGKLLLKVE